jgi:PAT family beta-lactamase induction signal transducer AmpG
VARYRNVPALSLMLALGFASGLPRLLVASTLAAWLSDSGLSMASVGLFAAVAMPYSLKFLWAPALDHVRLPILGRLGRRRGWMLAAGALLVAVMAAMATIEPAKTPLLLAALCLVLATASATFDTAFDAYRIEYLAREDYGTGAAASVFGYRLGMLVAGAGALILADHLPWGEVYALMAGVMACLMGVVLLAPEVRVQDSGFRAEGETLWASLRRALFEPFLQFIKAQPQWLAVLLFVLLYRLPDGFAGFMTTPFLLDVGFSKTELGAVTKLWGFGATILGMAAGGWLIRRYSVERCLVPFAIGAAATNLVYIALTTTGPEIAWLIAGITMDNLFGGAATAAAIAYMMQLCDKAFAATQYALLSALVAVPATTISASAGWVAESYGWVAMFAVSIALTLPALAAWRWVRRH